MNKKQSIPIAFHLLYLLLAAGLCFLYYKKIVEPADFNAPNSLNAVVSFETAKPYQFRLLIPLLFLLFKQFSLIPEKIIHIIYNVFVVYVLVLIYYKLLKEYFQNNRMLLWFAPIILYPMLWNYVILNQSFQYYDFTSILIFTIGLLFIMKENYIAFLITFIFGIINKETAGYLIFAYLLFNYKIIFTRKIILNVIILGSMFIAYKLFLSYLFRNNPGDTFEVGFQENIRIITNLFNNRIFMKNLGLNFGGLYIFVILLFVTGRWEKYPDRRKILINLAFIPYIILGIYIIYFTEVRVYTEPIPMVTTLFIIYLSTFKKFNRKPKKVE